MSLINVLGSLVSNGVNKSASSSSNANIGGIDVMNIIKTLNNAKGGSSNMNLGNGSSIDVGSVLKQIGGNSNLSSDLVNVILKQVGGSVLSQNMGIGNSSRNTQSSASAGPLGNMSISDIAAMAQNASAVLNTILANKK